MPTCWRLSKDRLLARERSASSSPIRALGSERDRLHPVLTPATFAPVETAMPSTFAGTEFGAWLQHKEIDTLTILGDMPTTATIDNPARNA